MTSVVKVNSTSLDSLFAKDGTRFECRRCGACCSFQVELSPEDFGRLIRADPNVERRLEQRDSRSHLTIQHRVDTEEGPARCIYLDNARRCSVYQSRPSICMLYPFFPVSASDTHKVGVKTPHDAVSFHGSAGSKFYVALDPSCPGLGHGGRVDWQKFKEAFERNCPKD